MTGQGSLCLKGRGANGAVPERVLSGHRGCDSGRGGRLLAVGNAVGAAVEARDCLWGRVKAGVLGGGVPPPPPPPASDSLVPAIQSRPACWTDDIPRSHRSADGRGIPPRPSVPWEGRTIVVQGADGSRLAQSWGRLRIHVVDRPTSVSQQPTRPFHNKGLIHTKRVGAPRAYRVRPAWQLLALNQRRTIPRCTHPNSP